MNNVYWRVKIFIYGGFQRYVLQVFKIIKQHISLIFFKIYSTCLNT